MVNKIKAFTLIELLVVVAIIGILAAVGVVAYNGYTKSAKKAAAHANFKMVIKYMVAENTKCELGEEKVMDGNLTCAGRTTHTLIQGAKDTFSNLKNPIDSSLSGIGVGGMYSGGSNNIGMVIMHHISAKQIRFGICYQYRCYENNASTNHKDENRFFEELVDFLD